GNIFHKSGWQDSSRRLEIRVAAAVGVEAPYTLPFQFVLRGVQITGPRHNEGASKFHPRIPGGYSLAGSGAPTRGWGSRCQERPIHIVNAYRCLRGMSVLDQYPSAQPSLRGSEPP